MSHCPGTRENRTATAFEVEYENLGQFVSGKGEDLGRGGMFLSASLFLPLNSVIRCVLHMPNTDRPLRIIGRVAHILTEPQAQARGRHAGMGIEFLDMGREDSERLLAFLGQFQALPRASGGPLRRHRESELLVVDDQPAYLEQLTHALTKHGFRIRTAENGLSGLAQCLKMVPDLILSDVEMPQMDGWALLRIVRGRASLAHIPFVFLTSLGDEAERLRGYRMGVDDFITKPYDLDLLAARIDRTLARNEQSPRGAIATKTLCGELDQVSLASLLLYLEQEGKSGELLLVRNDERATLFLSEGRVIKCQVGRSDLKGAERVFYALAWTEGRFEFAPQDVPEGDEIARGISDLVREHTARIDGAAQRAAQEAKSTKIA